jgi:hypothetical protein
MGKLKIATGLILLFLVGVLAGILGTEIYYKYQMDRFVEGGPPPFHRRMPPLIKRFSRDFNLTKQQQIEIEKIIKESEAKIFAIREKYMPEIREIRDQSLMRMSEKLHPDQRKKLEKLYEKIKRRRNKTLMRGN